ncbi:hypothetical protein scyTo_0000291 [Scyliorhinus torazame]|uniref:Uncharacterized protein n=1 Tax=Scyliorhinus torazame TaxID=75743 RepID=A0A401NUP3_SCYTO|nr:hypothetical protein [Scyliorhinus torazame]
MASGKWREKKTAARSSALISPPLLGSIDSFLPGGTRPPRLLPTTILKWHLKGVQKQSNFLFSCLHTVPLPHQTEIHKGTAGIPQRPTHS